MSAIAIHFAHLGMIRVSMEILPACFLSKNPLYFRWFSSISEFRNKGRKNSEPQKLTRYTWVPTISYSHSPSRGFLLLEKEVSDNGFSRSRINM